MIMHWKAACSGVTRLFAPKTLYNYIDLGLISLKNIDLPEKLIRNTKKDKVRGKKKNLGDSIELRDTSVENRDDFGNWEIDSILGEMAAEEPCVMSLTERKLRVLTWLKPRNHSADAMMEVAKELSWQAVNSVGKESNVLYAVLRNALSLWNKPPEHSVMALIGSSFPR